MAFQPVGTVHGQISVTLGMGPKSFPGARVGDTVVNVWESEVSNHFVTTLIGIFEKVISVNDQIQQILPSAARVAILEVILIQQ